MISPVFNPFPVLCTERISMKPITPADENEIFRLRSDEKINRYLDRKRATSVEDARQYIDRISAGVTANELIAWGIHLKETAGLIGTVCLWNISFEHNSAEIGYELLPEFQGQGFMREALGRVIRYAFDDLQADMLEAFAHTRNVRSSSLLLKSGFSRSRSREDELRGQNQFINMYIYQCVKKQATQTDGSLLS
jgi:ribosomal-protein-alanine N-acetyltransferase